MKRFLIAALLLLSLPATAAEIQPFGRGSWAELRQAHANRPIVVHFWGLTCAPCLAEMPHWAKLARERRDLNLVLIAADPPGKEASDQARYLDKVGLGAAESWSFADQFVDRLRFEIDPRWRGELPRTMLIGRDGTISATSGMADLAKIRAWLDGQRKTASR